MPGCGYVRVELLLRLARIGNRQIDRVLALLQDIQLVFRETAQHDGRQCWPAPVARVGCDRNAIPNQFAQLRRPRLLPFVNESGDFIGISAEFQNARPWRPDWLHAVHRHAEKFTIGTVTNSAAISWQRHPKRYSEASCFSYPFTRQTRIRQFRVGAGRNRNRMHLQHISIDFAYQLSKFRIIQPRWQHRDYKASGLNNWFQGTQPRSITAEIFLRAIEIKLELLQVYIVSARVA